MKRDQVGIIKLCGLQRCDCDKRARKTHTNLCLKDVCKRSLFERKFRTRKHEVVLRKEGELVGLKNLGATCYVNAYLQVWFYEPLIRQAIYDLVLNEDLSNSITDSSLVRPTNGNSNANASAHSSDSPATGVNGKPAGEKAKVTLSAADTEIMRELQFVFAALEHTKRSFFDPSGLVRALRLNAHEMQDADEFYTLFVRHKLEKVFSQHGNDVIARHFVGELVHENRCLNCQKTTQHVSAFSSLDLNIRKAALFSPNSSLNADCKETDAEAKQQRNPAVENHRSLSDCLQQYFAVERLSGENRYRCERCAAHCEAERRTILRCTPTVLCVQLLRFVYNPQRGRKQKLAAPIDFEDSLDLSPFVIGGPKTESDSEYRYQLASVIMHRGPAAHAGHYVSIIRMPDSRWFQFNDEKVERVKHSDLFPPAESTSTPPVVVDSKGKSKPKVDLAHSLSRAVRRDAYILIYRKVAVASPNSGLGVTQHPPDCAMRRVAADNEAYVRGARERASMQHAEVARLERDRDRLAALFATLSIDAGSLAVSASDAGFDVSRVAFVPKTAFRDWLLAQLNVENSGENDASASAGVNATSTTATPVLLSQACDTPKASVEEKEHEDERASSSGNANCAESNGEEAEAEAEAEADAEAEVEVEAAATGSEEDYEYLEESGPIDGLPQPRDSAQPTVDAQVVEGDGVGQKPAEAVATDAGRCLRTAPLSFADCVCEHGSLSPVAISRGALKAVDTETLQQLVAEFSLSFDTSMFVPALSRLVGLSDVCSTCVSSLDADARWRCDLQRDVAIVTQQLKAAAESEQDVGKVKFILVGRTTLRCWAKLSERARKPADSTNDSASTANEPAYFNAEICCEPHGQLALTALDRAVKVPESLFLAVFTRYFNFSSWPLVTPPNDADGGESQFRASGFYRLFDFDDYSLCEQCAAEQIKTFADKDRLDFLLNRPRSRFAFDRSVVRRRLLEQSHRVEIPTCSYNLVSTAWLNVLKRQFAVIGGRQSKLQTLAQMRRLRAIENCELLCQHAALRYQSLDNGEAVFLSQEEYATVRAVFPEIDFEIRCDYMLLPSNSAASSDVQFELVTSYTPEPCSQCAAAFEADDCAVDESAEELDYTDVQMSVRRLLTAADRDRYLAEERSKIERANAPSTNASNAADSRVFEAGTPSNDEAPSGFLEADGNESDAATSTTASPVKHVSEAERDPEWSSATRKAVSRKRTGDDSVASASSCPSNNSSGCAAKRARASDTPVAPTTSVRRSERILNREVVKSTMVPFSEVMASARGRKKEERLRVKVSSSMTISAVKCELARRCGAMASDQHVYWNGDELPSELSLREFAVPRSATLFLYVDEVNVDENTATFDDWLAEDAHSPSGRFPTSSGSPSALLRETGFRGTNLLDD